MKNEFNFKKCAKCGALVEVLKDCTCENCGIVCCGEKLINVQLNSQDFSAEKHLPVCEIMDNKIVVTINHVMEEDHYIEWVACYNKSGKVVKYLKPGQEAKVSFDYEKDSTILSYCNKHGLWYIEV